MMRKTSIKDIITCAAEERTIAEITFYFDGNTRTSTGVIERREDYRAGYYLNNALLPLRKIKNPRRENGILKLDVFIN